MKKKCSHPGCEKPAWVKGLCSKHYKEKYGTYVPRYKGGGVVVPKKEAKPDLPIAVLEPLSVQIPADMMRKIEATAEREFRTVDLQVQYYLHKGMEVA